MKTALPDAITTVTEAESYIQELYRNLELYHFDDDAHTIIWDGIAKTDRPTPEECDKLNTLRDQLFALPDFDPHGCALDLLSPHWQDKYND